MCTVVVMWLAGIPVADRAVLQLAASLREAELVDTAERLERAYDREARIVALDIPDREAILRVLEDCPEELAELLATLLQEHVWRQHEAPEWSPPTILRSRRSARPYAGPTRRCCDT